MSEPLRVLVVDDHAVVRAGLRLLIDREESMVVIDEAADANEAIFRVIEHKPDVLLIDVTLPGESGIEAIPKLLAASPDTKILVLSMHDDPRYVREAFAAGASAYVLKEAADAEEQAEARADPLSEREHEVLRLLALGHTNQEIAKSLYISVRTAETHRAHIMQKLRLTTRAELVRYALERGLLDKARRGEDEPE